MDGEPALPLPRHVAEAFGLSDQVMARIGGGRDQRVDVARIGGRSYLGGPLLVGVAVGEGVDLHVRGAPVGQEARGGPQSPRAGITSPANRSRPEVS